MVFGNKGDIQVQRAFSTSLIRNENKKNSFTKLLLGNYPYKIKDVEYNPNKKELMIAYIHILKISRNVLYMKILNI